ncbi:non-ribosomal peptide synthetase [Ancylothrix sp. C2]|uniref:non-ribosomal peptide synthetase n=1 Tax=Ancylothrix sp. D3o TaxID=2953691 RepID=UPI0021BB681F|nr:non-ribosomal peptide synthetase [Ancylothrix sp. D3o]MCT7951981.1 non-ribosomal peptide synthetase [Ancylothrix sp. D3o]
MKNNRLNLTGKLGLAASETVVGFGKPATEDIGAYPQIGKWNNRVKGVFNCCIHEVIERQAKLTPDAVAVVFKDEKLTYRQLDEKANQLANYLRLLGVGPDVIVGVCIERCLEMTIGFLGILKAGGAYLPLDPSYPAERLAWMLEDAKAPIVLSSGKLLKILPICEAKILCLDEDWEMMEGQRKEKPVCQTSPQNLAYVIYTSGSTGKPKGVLIDHQGVVNHGLAMAKLFKLMPADRVLQFSSISFDIATEEMFPTWFTGATLVLRSEECLSSTQSFCEFIEEKAISVLNLPTAFWHEWTDGLYGLQQVLPVQLRLVIVGGEKAAVTSYAVWRKLAGSENIRWINAYGPTETTVTATYYEPGSEIPEKLPIGRPIDNVLIYLLDEKMRPVPMGEVGEIYIGGAGVARGYLNRPEITAECFIPNVFLTSPEILSEGNNFETNWLQNNNFSGGYLYKTGDLARYLPDKNLEYIGRKDHQVKIRGFRIELGEIETILNKHPHIQQSIVTVCEDKPGEKRLIGYIVGRPESKVTAQQMRVYLNEKLPSYMVPGAFVLLEKLPMLPNGKIDRRNLPIPEIKITAENENFVAPRTPTEEVIAGIFAELLGISQLSIEENFFELGIHSLLAIQFISRLRDCLGVEISIQQLFHNPTVAELAFTLLQNPSQRTKIESIAPLLLMVAELSDSEVDLMLNFSILGMSV